MEGRVVDDHGDPVQNAELFMHIAQTVETESGSHSNLTNENSAISIGRTDNDGRFVAVVHRMFAEGAWADINLWAESSGFARSRMVMAKMHHGNSRNDIVIVLQRHGFISGRVIDEHGTGIEGITVVLGGFLDFMYEDRRKYPPEYLEAGNDPGSGRITRTDANGVYRFEGVSPRQYAVHISNAAGWRLAAAYSHVADVRPGESCSMPDHVLVRTGCLSFKLVDAIGTPLRKGSRATVTLHDEHSQTRHVLTIGTWGDGHYQRNEPPIGSFTGTIAVNGFRSLTFAVSIAEGSIVTLGALVLEAE